MTLTDKQANVDSVQLHKRKLKSTSYPVCCIALVYAQALSKIRSRRCIYWVARGGLLRYRLAGGTNTGREFFELGIAAVLAVVSVMDVLSVRSLHDIS